MFKPADAADRMFQPRPGTAEPTHRRNWLFRCAAISVALSYFADSFDRNRPRLEPDVNYLHWSTDVPAVTVCPVTASGADSNHRHHSPNAADDKRVLKQSEVGNTLNVNILKQTIELKKKDSDVMCKSMFKKCLWNGKDFNCCRHFQPHRFVVDKSCYSINSLQTLNKRKKLAVSYFSKNGELEMYFNGPVEISLFDPVEIRFGELQKRYVTVENNKELEVLYKTRQIIEHVSLGTLDISKRGCVLRDERMLFHHSVYSKSACLLECALRDTEIYVKNDTLCNCPSTCTEMEINTVWTGIKRSSDNTTKGIVTMANPATERLIMKAGKDYIDLTVMFACLMQLFAGINLLDIPKFIFNKHKNKSKNSKLNINLY